jgi:hypothetical protein
MVSRPGIGTHGNLDRSSRAGGSHTATQYTSVYDSVPSGGLAKSREGIEINATL